MDSHRLLCCLTLEIWGFRSGEDPSSSEL